MDEEQSVVSSAQAKKARNDANNANTVKNAAKVAEASGNPYAMAIGKAVNIADKMSGGKSTEMLGKQMSKLNRRNGLAGKMLQGASNKLAESGKGDQIGSAAGMMAAKNGSTTGVNSPNQKNKPNNSPKGNLHGNGLSNSSDDKKRETQDQASDGGDASFKASFKLVKYGLIACAFAFPIIIFCNLFMSSSQIYIKSIGLGNADSLSSGDVEEKINKKMDEEPEDLNEEVTEDDLSINFSFDENNNIEKTKDSNLIFIAGSKYLKRKYNEASLDDLEDFYPAVKDLSKNYDENMVYDFFFKMYNLYTTYNDSYNVKLDLPLLMATLMAQSDDMNEVFKNNLSSEDRAKTARKKPIAEFDYNYDWSTSGYISNKTSSEHDMEILAQNMISKQVKETCVDSSGKIIRENILRDDEIGTQTLLCEDGETYKTEDLGLTKDDVKYKKFLKEYLQGKYYSDGYKTQSTGMSSSSCNSIFPKYALTDEQLKQIASQAYHEQGSPKGAAAEASLMANLFELYGGDKYGEGANGLYNYVRNSGWFANSALYMDSKDAPKDVVAAVKKVLVEGKRILPGYIDEHDCIDCGSYGFDIEKIVKDGVTITDSAGLLNHDNYIKYKTVIHNKYGAVYTFYSFPTEDSDPFGYRSEKNREEKGEFFYDFDTGAAQNCTVTGSGSLSYTQTYSNGTATMEPGVVLSSEPDPSIAINYWSYIDSNNFVYPKDEATGKSLGAWPKDYASIPTQLNNVKVYQGAYIWPTTPTNGKYTFVYEHLGMDIMADFGTPIYSPVDGTLVYSTWGNTTNKGSDETAYSVTITPDKKVTFAGTTIDEIFFTHMSGIRYRCEWGQCNRKVKKGELLGFVGNAAGDASSVGWAPHLHLTYYNSQDYYTGVYTTNMEEFYGITSNTKRKAGE